MVALIALWKFVMEPILKEKGFLEEPLETPYTIQLEKLRAELNEKAVNANSAVECARIRKQIKELENKITEAEGENV